ncbi:hypothetical protein HPB51_021776 [Rhipicephalus microplus]|uniref:Tick transposon n=1 Tax=Rhipicephalus microplus TaxID=6941 RepID=A0A9J6DPZ6_RHIMP|nr:hypothetical protein HPB51_021776 [Rhipicephalus microplus]
MDHGLADLRKIGWQIEPVPIKAALPDDWKTTIQTKPLPRNMTLGKDDERRTARAKVVPGSWKRTPGLIVSASLRTKDPAIAEEVAVALALVHPSVDMVVTDSKTAYGSFRRGVISSGARAILSKCKPPGRAVQLVWVPAHSQVAGNTIADYHARKMSIRAEHEPEELPHPVTTFRDIAQMYREGRCRLPEPHPALTREKTDNIASSAGGIACASRTSEPHVPCGT